LSEATANFCSVVDFRVLRIFCCCETISLWVE